MRTQFRGIPELSVLYTLEDAIRDGLRPGDHYRGSDGVRYRLDEQEFEENAPMQVFDAYRYMGITR